MPIHRAQSFFIAGIYTWGEIWWRDTVDTIQQTLLHFQRLMQKRMSLLGKGAFLTEMRVSAEDELFDSVVDFPVGWGNNFPNDSLAQPFDALLCEVEAGSRYRKSLFISGQPLEVKFPIAEANQPMINWMEAWRAFRKEALESPANWAVRSQTREPNLSRLPIGNVFQDPLVNRRTTVIVPNLNITEGTYVRVSLPRAIYGSAVDVLNGVWPVQAPFPNEIHIGVTTPPGFDYTKGGFVSVLDYVYPKIGDMEIVANVRRKRGVTQLHSKGRRKSTKK